MQLANRIENSLDLKLFRKGFLVLSLGILPLIPINGLWIYLKKELQVKSPMVAFEASSEKKALEPVSFYESVFDSDTLFGKVSKESGVAISTVSMAELVKDFRLKGVILAGEPEAIVEDARSQKTSFLKKGEKIGELEVKKIEEGRLVLGYANEETKLEIQ